MLPVLPGRRPGVRGEGRRGGGQLALMTCRQRMCTSKHTCTPHASDKSHQLAVPTTKNYTVLQMESAGTPLHVHKWYTSIEAQLTPLKSNTASSWHSFLSV